MYILVWLYTSDQWIAYIASTHQLSVVSGMAMLLQINYVVATKAASWLSKSVCIYSYTHTHTHTHTYIYIYTLVC